MSAFGLFLLTVCTTVFDAGAYVQAPPDPPALQALAASLVAAPDDAARDRLLLAAPPDLARQPQFGHALNAAWQPVIYAGEYDRAVRLGEYARRLLLQRGDPVDAAYALFMLGFVDGARGDNQVALEKFAEAQRVFEPAKDEDKLARVLAGEGKVHLQLGDFAQALADTRRALEIYREIGGKEGIINTLNTSGSIFMAEGLTDRAMDFRQQALAVAGDDVAWQVYLFHNIANVYARRGERTQAFDWMSRSIAAAEQVGDRPNLASGLKELGTLHLEDGRLDLAEGEFRRALAIADEIGDNRRRTDTLTSLADLLSRRGTDQARAEALDLAERSAAVARETGEPAFIWRSETLLGQLFLARQEPARAREAFEESIAAIEDARGHIAAGDTGATAFLEDKLAPYHGMVTLLVRENRPAEALAMAERAKARVLVDILRGPKLDPSLAMTAAERATARQRADEVAALNRQLAEARNARPPAADGTLAEIEARLGAARRARDDAEEDFFIAHPELSNRRPPPAGDGLSNAALDALLADGRTALIEYVVTDSETIVFTVTKPADASPGQTPVIRAQRLPLDRAGLSTRAETFRAALAERSMGWQAGARALGNELLGPVRDVCRGSARVIIVADGPLWGLPFQALAVDPAGSPASPMRTLWETCAVDFAPSLTFLAQTPGAPLTRPARLLAIGDPDLGRSPRAGKAPASVLVADELEPLPDAREQVRALLDLYGADRSKALVGREAHENAFKRVAGDYDVIHFATHGSLNDTAPMYSRLLLAQTHLAADEDGLLEVWEWLSLRLRARLAVFSACESGRGRVNAGEGMIGLSWALFRAGCPAVVVSQWKVDSAASTRLMIAFHRRLLAGDAPAEALRSAGLALAQEPRYRHPFYWAPFVFVGADRGIVQFANPESSPIAHRH